MFWFLQCLDKLEATQLSERRTPYICALSAASVCLAVWWRRGRRTQEEVYRDLLRGLTVGSNPQALLERIAERAVRLAGGIAAYVETIDSSRGEVVAAVAHDGEHSPSQGTRGPYKGSVAEQAIEAGKPIILSDVALESRSILASVKEHTAAVVLPLIADGVGLGALIVLEGKRKISPSIINQLQMIADLSAVSIRRVATLERLENALRAKEELQRVLAHDLRNPVNTISVAASALSHSFELNDQECRLVEMIQRSALRMNRLIQDLIDSAVIEKHGALPMNPQVHPAQHLAEEVCELTKIQAKAKTVQVQCDIVGNATVWVDRDRLLQVLMNLIDNAIKFTPQGGTVTVRTEAQPHEVRFSVADTGPGIPEPDRARIFEPYWQAPSTAHLGAGLGLSIAKQIVEQHGGRIWVESVVGRGSKFIFTLPAAA